MSELVEPKLYIYDLETLKNFFSFTGKYEGEKEYYSFEMSARRNEREALLAHLAAVQYSGAMMVGFNNLGFDYPILHELMMHPYTFTYDTAYQMCRDIIERQNDSLGGPAGTNFLKDRLIPQVDLARMNHFENKAKRVGLKTLQFAMRSKSIEDLPVEIGKDLTEEEMEMTLKYNLHDVTETEKFLTYCKPLIKMRKEILDVGVVRGDVLNYSDVKIGVEYLINKIGRSKCFVKGSTPNQSIRNLIMFSNIILPKIKFRDENFNEVLEWFKSTKVTVGVGERPKLVAKLADIDFHFGLGGVHASVSNQVYQANDTYMIRDIDVSGMYVAVAIANRFYPEHLGEDFINAYKQLQYDRKQYPKGTSMNALLKLAGNGVYGNSNNPYSCFYDPKYTYSVTVNGQLQLLQLVEMLSFIPGLEVIQANTDGVTVYMPREMENLFNFWCSEWEKETLLKLEHVDYEGMWIADVNNYVAKTTEGKIKLKGKYWYPKSDSEYEGQWSKDFSNMTAQKVAEQAMVNDYDVKQLLRLMSNPFDFMLRYKTTSGFKVMIGDELQQKTVRYYVSTEGQPMKKIGEPKDSTNRYKRKNKISDTYYENILAEIGEGVWDERIHTKNKKKYARTTTSVQAGRLVKACNKAEDFNWSDVDYDYYEKEINKLIIRGDDVIL